MNLRLPHRDNNCATLICVYAPTLKANPTTKEAFYRYLRSLLQRIDKADKIVIIGDFNTRVSKNHNNWPGALGRNGIGNCNNNSQLLLELYAEHSLAITNTLFQ